MNEWQDISTAPKDGNDFLCFIWSKERQAGAFLFAYWSDAFGEFLDQCGDAIDMDKLSHWMPLPPKPPVAA